MKTCMGILLAFLLMSGALPARAAQDDPRLDALFAQLQQETDFEKAQAVEDNIWLLWRELGDASTGRLFARGRQALLRGGIEMAIALEPRKLFTACRTLRKDGTCV